MEKNILNDLESILDNIKNQGITNLNDLEIFLNDNIFNEGLNNRLIKLIFMLIIIEKRNEEKYAELIELFNEVLKIYKQLANELNINSSLNLSELYTYLLWNGYLSYNHTHIYDESVKNRSLFSGLNIKDIQSDNIDLGLIFMDVILGKGVCLNYASGLNKFLTECGKDSHLLVCNALASNDTKAIYTPNIQRKIKKVNLLKRKINFLSEKILIIFMNYLEIGTANHVVNLIDDGKKFVFDSTQMIGLNIGHDGNLFSITNNQVFTPNNLMSFLMNFDIEDKIFLKSLGEQENIDQLGKIEYIDSFESTLEIIHNNQALLSDAYDSIHPILETMVNKYNKSKQKVR